MIATLISQNQRDDRKAYDAAFGSNKCIGMDLKI